MTTVNVYLSIDGNCNEAFDFYKSVFGSEFSYVGKYKDMPKLKEVSTFRRNKVKGSCMFLCQ